MDSTTVSYAKAEECGWEAFGSDVCWVQGLSADVEIQEDAEATGNANKACWTEHCRKGILDGQYPSLTKLFRVEAWRTAPTPNYTEGRVFYKCVLKEWFLCSFGALCVYTQSLQLATA